MTLLPIPNGVTSSDMACTKFLVQIAGTDEHPSVTESKIRDVIRKNMRIHREISILRVKRAFNGPNVRGCKPITVHFDKWEVRQR